MPVPAGHTYTNSEGRTWTVRRLIEAADAEGGNSYNRKVSDLLPEDFASVWGSKMTRRDELIDHVSRIVAVAREAGQVLPAAPVLLDHEDNVLDGLHRLLFAAASKQHTIECRTLRVMPPDDETAYMLDEYTRRADAVVTQANWAWQAGLAVVPKMGTIKRRLLVLQHSDQLAGINGFGLMLLDEKRNTRHTQNVHPADYRLDLTHEPTRLYVCSLEAAAIDAATEQQGTPAATVQQKPLPCHPCPHKGACCKYGASLTIEEAIALEAEYGEGTVVSHDNSFGCSDPYRTKLQPHPIHGEACVFLTGKGACLIHDKSRYRYPKTCQGFPWTDDEGQPYVHDKTICPEFVQITEPRGEWKRS